MELKEKLYLIDSDGEKFMGAGVLWLMEAIEKQKSLRSAALDMGLSYSKAYNMITRLEENLGHEILNRRHGGSSREGATLTPYALSFMEIYKKFQKRMKEHADNEYIIFEEDLRRLQEECNG